MWKSNFLSMIAKMCAATTQSTPTVISKTGNQSTNILPTTAKRKGQDRGTTLIFTTNFLFVYQRSKGRCPSHFHSSAKPNEDPR